MVQPGSEPSLTPDLGERKEGDSSHRSGATGRFVLAGKMGLGHSFSCHLSLLPAQAPPLRGPAPETDQRRGSQSPSEEQRPQRPRR